MDVREKLVELLHNARMNALWHNAQKPDEYITDMLMEDGVTVQEWISVKDRLPEDDSDVLAYLRIGEEGRIYPANYARGMWFDCLFNTPATSTTTHWMPLPQPPKGE